MKVKFLVKTILLARSTAKPSSDCVANKSSPQLTEIQSKLDRKRKFGNKGDYRKLPKAASAREEDDDDGRSERGAVNSLKLSTLA